MVLINVFIEHLFVECCMQLIPYVDGLVQEGHNSSA